MARFEFIGVCVNRGQLTRSIVTFDRSAHKELVYQLYTVTSGESFALLAIDPESGESWQYRPEDWPPHGAASVGGNEEGDVFITTAGGRVYYFDTERRQFEKLAELPHWLWHLHPGADDWLYVGTSTENRPSLVRIHAKTKVVEDLGILGPPDDANMFSQELAIHADGTVYSVLGLRVTRVVAWDPRTGDQKLLTPPEGEWPESPRPYRDRHGQVFFRLDGGQIFTVQEGDLREIEKNTPIETAQLSLGDGRKVTLPDDRVVVLEDPSTGQQKETRFDYDLAAGPVSLQWMDGKLYGTVNYPARSWSYDTAAGNITDHGQTKGTTYRLVPCRGKLWFFGYAMPMLCWDPTRPWNAGESPESNPRSFGRVLTVAGKAWTVARAALYCPQRDRIYSAWAGAYGPARGAIVELDPETGDWELFQTHDHQSAVSLTKHEPSGLLVGGSHRAYAHPSTIISPGEKDCYLFLWDPAARRKVWEEAVIPGGEQIISLACTSAGKIVGICENQLFAFDVAKRQVTDLHSLPQWSGKELEMPVDDGQLGFSTVFLGARPRDVVRFDALRTSPDGTLYCLCTTGEFLKIDPNDGSYEIITTLTEEAPRTMQPLDDRIYFATGTRLGVLHFD